MQVLITHAGDATERWGLCLAPALGLLGIRTELICLPLALPRRPLRTLRVVRARLAALRLIRRGSQDAVILGPGGGFLRRPRFLKRILQAASSSGTAVFFRWGDCAWILERILADAPQRRTDRSRRLLTRPAITHLAMTQSEATGLVRLLGLQVTEPIGNVRSDTGNFDAGLLGVLPVDPPIVLNVASIQRRKGTDLFIEIARIVRSQRPDIRFVWVGGLGADPEWAETQIQNSSGIVEFVGHHEDPSSWVRQASVVLMTSRSEAASGAVLEAMADARCVIAFDATGTPELLGGTGIVIENGDIEAAAAAVSALVERPALERLSLDARLRFESEFAPSPAARKLSSVLEKALFDAKR